jgi:F-type H+-transporting ATPase subunit c
MAEDRRAAMDTSSLVPPAAAIAIGVTGLGAALACGRAVAAAVDGTARNPGAAGTIRGVMVLGLGMIDSVLALVLTFLFTRM